MATVDEVAAASDAETPSGAHSPSPSKVAEEDGCETTSGDPQGRKYQALMLFELAEFFDTYAQPP